MFSIFVTYGYWELMLVRIKSIVSKVPENTTNLILTQKKLEKLGWWQRLNFFYINFQNKIRFTKFNSVVQRCISIIILLNADIGLITDCIINQLKASYPRIPSSNVKCCSSS